MPGKNDATPENAGAAVQAEEGKLGMGRGRGTNIVC